MCMCPRVCIRAYMTEGKENVYVCARVCTYGLQAREMDTRWQKREEANRLHYANAVQLQLTMAKNRCRYRGMLSRTPRGFLHSSSRSVSLSSSRSCLLYFARCVTLVPRIGLHPIGMKRCRGCRSNRCFSIRTLHRRKSPSRFISLSLSLSLPSRCDLFSFFVRRCAHYPTILPNVSVEYFIFSPGPAAMEFV